MLILVIFHLRTCSVVNFFILKCLMIFILVGTSSGENGGNLLILLMKAHANNSIFKVCYMYVHVCTLVKMVC